MPVGNMTIVVRSTSFLPPNALLISAGASGAGLIVPCCYLLTLDFLLLASRLIWCLVALRLLCGLLACSSYALCRQCCGFSVLFELFAMHVLVLAAASMLSSSVVFDSAITVW